MQPTRKRRAQADASPSPTPTRRRISNQTEGPDPILSGEDDQNDDDPDGDIIGGRDSQGQMVKKLVRLALASEYSRNPIRRQDITAKVMAPNTSRQFKIIFREAQQQLYKVFGMILTELPQKEKITISQKRAMQRSQNGNTASSTKAYVLTSTLPASYRISSILTPSRIPSTSVESAYTAFYTFVISVISLSPRGMIPEPKLERYLKRVNADNHCLGGEKTEKIFKRMEREGYVVKVRERDGGGEESVDYMVGPRGKAEIGEKGVAGVVRKVYGKKDIEAEELEKRLVRSLGEVVIDKKTDREDGETEHGDDGGEGGESEAPAADRRSTTNGADKGRRRTRGLSERNKGRALGARGGGDDEEEEEEEVEEEEEEEEEEGEGGDEQEEDSDN